VRRDYTKGKWSRSVPADLVKARARMVGRQLRRRGIVDERVLAAFAEVPREAFMPAALRHLAYADRALPIECGQTISQPYVVALMVEAAELGQDDLVLEIGAGSGYAAAVMSRVARRVLTIERHEALAESAKRRLAELGYDNIEVRAGDGTLGWPERAPFDAIICAASGPRVPEPWRRQLAIGGRLVMPRGDVHETQELVRLTREDEDRFTETRLGAVMFVPLIGAEG
jgi:protein-L-isoaspartate(D-aspartate) O-methyltransferase